METSAADVPAVPATDDDPAKAPRSSPAAAEGSFGGDPGLVDEPDPWD